MLDFILYVLQGLQLREAWELVGAKVGAADCSRSHVMRLYFIPVQA